MDALTLRTPRVSCSSSSDGSTVWPSTRGTRQDGGDEAQIASEGNDMERHELETLIYEKDGPIARIILNRPEKANAQNSAMVWEVENSLKDAEADYAIKVVIMKANGRGFCAGHDVGGAGGPSFPEFAEAKRSRAPVGRTGEAVCVARAAPVGVPEADRRGGARVLPRWRHLLRVAQRHRGRGRGRLLPDAAPARARPPRRRDDDRAVGDDELPPGLRVPLPLPDGRRARGAPAGHGQPGRAPRPARRDGRAHRAARSPKRRCRCSWASRRA